MLSVFRPYCEKQSITYWLGASNTAKTPQRKSLNTGRPSRSTEDTTSTVPFCFKIPPSATGRKMCGNSSTPQGGNSKPLLGGIKSQALDTAAISRADLVPSKNELNICALKSPLATCSSEKP